MKNLILLLMYFAAYPTYAQVISGRIFDEKKEPLYNVAVYVFQDGRIAGGNISDYDGNFKIKPLDTGSYTLLFFYPGYDSLFVNKVPVQQNQTTFLNNNLSKSVKVRKCSVVQYTKPAIIAPETLKTTQDISNINYFDTGENYRKNRGYNLLLSGPRIAGTQYIIDGVDTVKKDPIVNSGNGKTAHSGLNKAYKKIQPDNAVINPNHHYFDREEFSEIPYRSLFDIIGDLPPVGLLGKFSQTEIEAKIPHYEIAGYIRNEKKKLSAGVLVMAYKDGILLGKTESDDSGYYVMHLYDSEHYSLCFAKTDYDTLWITGIPVFPDARTTVNASLKLFGIAAKSVKMEVIEPLTFYSIPDPGTIIFTKMTGCKNDNEPDLTEFNAFEYLSGTGKSIITAGRRDEKIIVINERIPGKNDRPLYTVNVCTMGNEREPNFHSYDHDYLGKMPANTIGDIIALLPNIYQQRRGMEPSFAGSGTSGNLYYYDGVQLMR